MYKVKNQTSQLKNESLPLLFLCSPFPLPRNMPSSHRPFSISLMMLVKYKVVNIQDYLSSQLSAASRCALSTKGHGTHALGHLSWGLVFFEGVSFM